MLLAIYITLGYFTLFFIVATIIKNNSIVDIGWGFGFVLVSWILFFVNGTYSVTQIIINVLISLWGLRLFYHILKRNLFEKEDFRYLNWRKDWGKWVIPRAFLQIFMLQAIFQFSIGLTSYSINTNDFAFSWLSIIGIVIWIFGYFYEVQGDRELKAHIKNKETRGTLLSTGLWKTTRHPNYFGEATMWWGLFIFAIINGAPIYVLLSPIVITFVLYFISTPLLEKKMAERSDWEEYAKKTPMFLPIKLKK